jgi:hypothetical protein
VRVTAALCWWNELPEDLEACVRGIALIADKVVAADGAYRRYPGATVASDPEQRVAAEVGLECEIIQPRELWAGQVAKRMHLLREAAKDSDWIVPLDADHIIHTARRPARAALAAMPDKVNSVGVDFFTPIDHSRPREETIATNWHGDLAGETLRIAQIVRAFDDYRVVCFHWNYVAVLGNHDGYIQIPWGGKADAQMPVPYVVEHRSLYRTTKQIMDGRAFCNDREIVKLLTGQEDDQPGLPPPKYDISTIPYRPKAKKPSRAALREARRAAIKAARRIGRGQAA